MKIIYGTTNKHKLEQIENMFKYENINIEVLSLKDIGFNEEIEETGTTFEENSMIKAKAIKEFCSKKNINEIIVTDDAGLCVDALNGEPGVYSHRWAGENTTQEQKINKLLEAMKDISKEKRTAQFVCVLTAILKDENIIICKGETKGSIAEKAGLMGNLTYMPIFIPEGSNKVMNEMNPEDLKTTHREKAFLELISILKKEED